MRKTKLHDVAVLGVGMHPFGMFPDSSNADMARIAGLAAMKDAGVRFDEVDASYVAQIFAPVMTGVRVMKEFGLTGLPVQRLDNASATGSAAFFEACHAVSSGRYDVVMVLGFDKMTSMIQETSMNTDPAYLEDSILPAGFFAMWATRRIHERGTKPEHLARIAAKNWNNGALNPMSPRRPDKVITAETVLGSRMVAWPLTAMMSCPIGDGAACAIVGRADLAKKLRPDRPVVMAASRVPTKIHGRLRPQRDRVLSERCPTSGSPKASSRRGMASATPTSTALSPSATLKIGMANALSTLGIM